jgi:3-dehydroquinate dehydratase II
MAKNILVVNGPNLNILGSREPERYGNATLVAIEKQLHDEARRAAASVTFFQSNSESALVERIQAARSEGIDFVLINPAAYTHTSVAIRDALAAVAIPFIEIHLTNVHAREPFRHRSYLSDIALGVVTGLGAAGYRVAMDYALAYTKE